MYPQTRVHVLYPQIRVHVLYPQIRAQFLYPQTRVQIDSFFRPAWVYHMYPGYQGMEETIKETLRKYLFQPGCNHFMISYLVQGYMFCYLKQGYNFCILKQGCTFCTLKQGYKYTRFFLGKIRLGWVTVCCDYMAKILTKSLSCHFTLGFVRSAVAIRVYMTNMSEKKFTRVVLLTRCNFSLSN